MRCDLTLDLSLPGGKSIFCCWFGDGCGWGKWQVGRVCLVCVCWPVCGFWELIQTLTAKIALRRLAMKTALRLSLYSFLLLAINGPTVLAQTPSGELSFSTRQRVEALLRSQAEFPPATSLSLKVVGPSELPGFDKLSAHFASALTGASGEVSLLISKDGSQLAQFTRYDIAADPRMKVPSIGRPSKGGPATAPVLVVGFDDLQCPYCAELHHKLFPALIEHYKDQVRIVYQSLPSEGTPGPCVPPLTRIA